MDSDSVSHRLNSIDTLWSVVCRAHTGPTDDAQAAQRQILERYQGAIRRYLYGALRDRDAAEELFQEFAYRFLHGDLRGADPNRGRFRDFVKGVLYHLIADHHKRQQRQPRLLSLDHPEPAVEPPSVADMDREFLANWRDELLARTWAALSRVEQEHGQPFYTVLRFRAENPSMASPQMAEQLSGRLGKPLTATGVRQTLHRARERFADLLIDEVAHSLEKPSLEQLEQELGDLGLLEHCRPALQRRMTNDE
jgi:RNA polymerase sigma-70 factor (ECF subfamily)